MPLANTPLPSLIVPFCARIYGGPQLSRQNQKPHGKNKIPHGKTENLKAKTKTSRQNRKPHGKKTKTSRQNRKFCLFCFRREVFGFAVRYFVFAVTVVGHHTNQILILKYDFWADIKLIV